MRAGADRGRADDVRGRVGERTDGADRGRVRGRADGVDRGLGIFYINRDNYRTRRTLKLNSAFFLFPRLAIARMATVM